MNLLKQFFMRKSWLLCCFMLLGAMYGSGQGVIYKYRVADDDVIAANDIFYGTSGETWKHNDNWPLKLGLKASLMTPYGVKYEHQDTTITPYPAPEQDTGIITLRVLELDLKYNDLSGGNLPGFSLERLTYARFSGNALSSVGVIVAPRLSTLVLSDNSISAFPAFNLPGLAKLELDFNSLTSIPLQIDYPNLRVFNISYNQISGGLPNWDLPSMREFYATGNSFTGSIPSFNFPEIEIFNVSNNDLTGTVPDFSWPKLIRIDVSNNQLSGDLPDMTAPSLRQYRFGYNQFTGNLKNVDYPELEDLSLYYNDLDGIIEASLDLPNLTYLGLEANELTGPLPNFNLPSLQEINLDFNHISGPFPNADMPDLKRILIWQNNIESLPDFTSSSPQLHDLRCVANRLEFDDLIPYVGLSTFLYGVQQDVDMYAVAIGDSFRLSVNVGGQGNEYEWWGYGQVIEESGTDEYMIVNTEDPSLYHCRITNPMLSDLTLHSVLASTPISKCWNNGLFDVCLLGSDAKWEEGDDKNEIKSTWPLVINDFVYFDGVFQLDTVDLAVKINGMFFLKNIPLPGGNAGNFTLAQGEYELSLAGSDGVITGFINDALSTYVPEIGGLKIKLDNLQLVGGMNANGVSLAFEVSFNNITPSCGNTSGQTTKIKIEGLAITSQGISVDGLEVADMGFAPGFCLKQLVAAYDQGQDKLSFGLTILTPFIEVGGGLGFLSGELDSIAMRAVLQNHIIPIANTGVGIIGCEGRINSIVNPPWNMRFGGIFSSVLSDDLFQLTTSVEYIPPAEIKIEAGDGKFFNPPYYDDWWQIEGGIYGSIDLRSNKMQIGGTVKLAPYEDGNDKKFMGNGSIDLSYRSTSQGVFLGKFSGMLTIPEFSSTFPFDWLSAKVGLPYSASGDGLLLYKAQKPQSSFLIGNIDLGGRIGQVQYRVEFGKPYDDPDFFSLLTVAGDVTRGPAGAFDHTFVTPEGANMAIITVANNTILPDVSLFKPDGTEINESNPTDDAEIDRDASAHKTFWTLYDPPAGLWTVSPNVESTVDVYFFMDASEFAIEATIEVNGIHVSWDATLFIEGDSIDFFADDDQDDYDGTYVMTADASGGEAIIPNELIESECYFALHVMAHHNQNIQLAYAEQFFESNSGAFAPPTDIDVQFDAQTLQIEVTWTPSTHPDIAGYVVQLVENNIARTIGMPYSDESAFVYQLAEYNGQTLVFYAYGSGGEVSCRSAEFDLISSGVEVVKDPVLINNLLIYPNPFSDVFTIRLTSDTRQTGVLRVYNEQGILARSIEGLNILEGVNEFYVSMRDFVPGHYFVAFYGDHTTLIGKAILMR